MATSVIIDDDNVCVCHAHDKELIYLLTRLILVVDRSTVSRSEIVLCDSNALLSSRKLLHDELSASSSSNVRMRRQEMKKRRWKWKRWSQEPATTHLRRP